MTQAFTVSEEGLRLQLWVLDILNAISFTLLFYDYFITLEAEVTRFWQRGRKTTLASTLFFTNRYIALLGNFPVIVMYFWYSAPSESKTETCHQLETFHEFYLCFTQFLTAAILCLRTWAIYGRTRKMGIFLLALVFTTLALALFGTLHSLHAPDKVGSQSIYIGCVSPKGQIQSIGFLIAWGALAMFDCIIFALTMYWTWGHFKGMMGAKISRQHRGLSAVRILLRDGTVYFVVIILFNIANILTFAVGNMYTRGIASVFGNIISSVMISRLMLNLRDPALDFLPATHAGKSQNETHSAMIFKVVSGPLRGSAGESDQSGDTVDTSIRASDASGETGANSSWA